jgi:putative oxidoreductase
MNPTRTSAEYGITMLRNGWVFTSQGGGWEYPAFLVAASIALWLLGDGVLALRRSPRFAPG